MCIICLIFEYTQLPFVSEVPGSEFAFLETSPNKRKILPNIKTILAHILHIELI